MLTQTETKNFNGSQEIEMPHELKQRWSKNPIFIELLENGVLQKNLPMGIDRRQWYKQFAPLIKPYMSKIDTLILDCRHIDLSNRFIEQISLGYALDYGTLEKCLFANIAFQDATAQNASFRDSRFVCSHMTPFFASRADFHNCTFIKCYFTGIYAGITRDSQQEKFYGTPTDLTNCKFSRSVGSSTDFDRCDFRGSDFTEAYFEDCRFDESDLRNVKLESTRFVNCNFANAWLSDTPEDRQIVAQGNNRSTEQIHWKPVK